MKTGSDQWKKRITDGLKAMDIHIPADAVEQFAIHARELLKWNKSINLTAITDPGDMAVKHFLDSVSAAKQLPDRGRVLDIGSGGGFPGIPLKVARPELSVTMIDASRKKVNFQKHVIRALNLENIEALHVRAEELASDPGYAGKFDVVISRALGSLDKFIGMAWPLVGENGTIMAMKGRFPDAEIKSLQPVEREKGKSYQFEFDNKTLILEIKIIHLYQCKDERTIVSMRKTTFP